MKKMKTEIIITFIVMVVVGTIFNGVISVLAHNNFLNWQVLVCGILVGGWYFMSLLAHKVKTFRSKAIVWLTVLLFVALYANFMTILINGIKNNKIVFVLIELFVFVCSISISEITKHQSKTSIKNPIYEEFRYENNDDE